MSDFESKLFSGFIVGFGILIITQLLTIYRDYRRTNQQILKDLYLPMFSQIQKCYDTETNFRPDHDIVDPLHIETLFNNILTHIERNLPKCDMYLIKHWYVYNWENTFDDFRGEKVYLKDIKLIAIFTKSFELIYKRSIGFERKFRKIITKYSIYFSGLFYFTELINDREKALEVSKLNWIYQNEIDKIFNKIDKKKYDRNKAINTLIDNVEDDKKQIVKKIFEIK